MQSTTRTVVTTQHTMGPYGRKQEQAPAGCPAPAGLGIAGLLVKREPWPAAHCARGMNPAAWTVGPKGVNNH